MIMSKDKHTPVTPENMRILAEKLIDYFAKEECWYEMGIYVDNERWSSNPDKNDEKFVTGKETVYYVQKNVDIKSRLEYSNPETVSLYFEGPLYETINYNDYNYISKLTQMFLEKYNLYFEQGDAWSMAAYEN